MKMVAGQPRNLSGLPGMLQKLFHQLGPPPAGFAALPTQVAAGKRASSCVTTKPGPPTFRHQNRVSHLHTAGPAAEFLKSLLFGGSAHPEVPSDLSPCGKIH